MTDAPKTGRNCIFKIQENILFHLYNVAPHRYYLVITGTFTRTARNQLCSDIGKQVLSNIAECKEAAAIMNLNFEGPTDNDWAPKGCSFIQSAVWNTRGHKKRDSDSKAICRDFGRSLFHGVCTLLRIME